MNSFIVDAASGSACPLRREHYPASARRYGQALGAPVHENEVKAACREAFGIHGANARGRPGDDGDRLVAGTGRHDDASYYLSAQPIALPSPLCNGAVLNYFAKMAKARALRPAEADAQSDVELLMAPADLACTHTSLRRAARRLGQLYDEAIAPTGLTSPQALLLAQIDVLSAFHGEAGPTLGVLADKLAIRISALTHALRPLVRDGLIEVRQDDQDRRAKRSAMTALGKARHKQMLGLWIDANSRVEAALGAASTKKLKSLANRIASEEFLDAYAAGGSHANPRPAATRG